MAVDNSLGAAFIELGIDLTRLESDFLAADQTIQQNLSRLNRERNLIELRAQVEIGGLEDAEQILEVKTRTLNQQLQIQRDKVLLVEAAFKQLANSQGESATATQNMEARLNRERLALQRLEQQLQQTTQAQKNLNSSGTSSNNSNFSVAKLKELFLTNFDSKLGKLSEALPAVGSLAEKATTALAAIPTPAKAAVVALTAIPIAIKTVENSLLSLAEPAITAGDAFYVASRGVQMSIKDFAQLSTVCKVTGIELSEVTTVMRRLNMQIVRGGESAAVKALKKFGVEVRNSNGELKNAYEMSLALAEGLERAQAAGKGKDFIAGILGRNATGDIVTYLEDLKGNIELAKTIVKNGLFDPVRAHNTQGLINTMNAQAAQLGSAFSSALLPIAEKLVPNITKRMGELTKVIADNANGIKNIANAVAEVADVVGTLSAKTVELGVKGVGTVGEALNGDTNAIIKNYGNATKEIKNEQDLFNAELAKMLPTQRAALLEGTPQYNLFKSQIKKQFQELQKYRDDNLKSWADFRRDDEKAMAVAKKAASEYTEEEMQASLKRAEKYAEELQKLQIEIEFANDSYGKAIANLDLNYRNALNQDYLSDKEKTVLSELNAAQIEQLEQEKEDKLSDIRDAANAKFQTNLENQLAAIEKQKDDWISAGMEEAEAEELIQRQKAKTIEELEASWNERVLAINGSALEQKLTNIEIEKQAWIDKGIDETRATEIAEKQKAKAFEDAENDIRDKEEQLEDAIKNRNKLSQDRAKIYEDFERQAKETISQIQSIWDTELNNQLQRIEREKQAYIQKGVDEVAAAKWAAQAKVDAERNAAMQILKSQLQAYRAFERGGYDALKRYELNQLYKQGITQKDLQMTPEQLHKFDFAQKAVQNSLMPNFMTKQDSDRQSAAQGGASNFKLPEVSVGMTAEWQERLKQNSEQIENANEKISKLSNEISKARGALLAKKANSKNNNDDENLSVEPKDEPPQEQPSVEPKNDNPPAVDTPQNETPQKQPEQIKTPDIDTSGINSIFESLKPQIENVSNYFEGLSGKVSDVTEAFSSLVEKLNQLDFSKSNTPPNITNNVSINEAHAWDYSHIQDLAEKVADVITPKILSAIGGNSNGY